jgi:HlyD family secretion protein
MTRNISVGQTVAASFNTPTLFIIAKDITRMQVQAAVSEADIGDVRDGLRATFTVDAYPDISFTGTVNQIRLEPVVSSNVVTYSTIITAPNQDLKLKPGMTANIFIFTKEVDSTMLISAKAIKWKPDATMEKQFKIIPDPEDNGGDNTSRKSAGGGTSPRPRPSRDTASQEIDTNSLKPVVAYIWVKLGDSLIEKKISTGLNDDTHVQILSGLSPDEEVVIGVETQAQAAAKAGSGAVRSPFMPARRPSGGSRASGAAGAGGGGSKPAGGSGR